MIHPQDITAAEQWLRRPNESFVEWLQLRPLGEHSGFATRSVQQYVAMWGRFVKWLHAHSHTVVSFDAGAIEAFLRALQGRQGPPADATVRRYLMLIERVVSYLVEQGLRGAGNPATDLLRKPAYRYHEPKAPVFLRPALAERYTNWVMDRPIKRWTDVRDKALRCVFLSSGITVEEARCLDVEDVLLEEGCVVELRIAPQGLDHVARSVPVAPWARSALTEWTQLRASMFSPTRALFVARSVDFKIDELGTSAMSATEIFTIVQEAMLASGHQGQRQGPATLRHTFTARQLAANKDEVQVAMWLGLKSVESLDPIKRQLPRAGGNEAV